MDNEDCSRGWRASILAAMLVFVLALVAETLMPVAMAAERQKGRDRTSRSEAQRLDDAQDLLAAWQRSGVGPEIVGGTTVPQGRFTFMSFVLFEVGADTFQCGGSLIAPSFVLTAAHCVEDEINQALPPSAFTLFIGEADLDLVGPENVRDVVEVSQHPGWDPLTFVNDVAVLELDEPVPATIAQPLSFVGSNQTEFNDAGRAAVVAGWGRISTNGPTSNRLLEANVDVVSDAVCGDAYGSEFVASVMVCAAAPGRDSCFGDSGGPLMGKEVIGHKVKKKKKRKHRKRRKKKIAIVREIQMGIVSFGTSACANPAAPGVYTRLSAPGINDFVVSVVGG